MQMKLKNEKQTNVVAFGWFILMHRRNEKTNNTQMDHLDKTLKWTIWMHLWDVQTNRAYDFARKRPSLKSFHRNYLQKSALLPLNLCCLHATSACTATIDITATSSNEQNASSSSVPWFSPRRPLGKDKFLWVILQNARPDYGLW